MSTLFVVSPLLTFVFEEKEIDVLNPDCSDMHLYIVFEEIVCLTPEKQTIRVSSRRKQYYDF